MLCTYFLTCLLLAFLLKASVSSGPNRPKGRPRLFGALICVSAASAVITVVVMRFVEVEIVVEEVVVDWERSGEKGSLLLGVGDEFGDSLGDGVGEGVGEVALSERREGLFEESLRPRFDEEDSLSVPSESEFTDPPIKLLPISVHCFLDK